MKDVYVLLMRFFVEVLEMDYCVSVHLKLVPSISPNIMKDVFPLKPFPGGTDQEQTTFNSRPVHSV